MSASATPPHPTQPLTVSGRFEAIAREHRAAVAIASGEVKVRYSELRALAGASRARVARLGRTKPGLVGILTIDRISAVQTMLGVAGSGHAYVLLDSNDPDKRLEHIIGEAAPFALFADAALVERARRIAGKGCAVIDIDGFEPSKDDDAVEGLEPGPDSLLYVSFTSGSTGVPKGVCQTHRNLIFYVDCYIEAMGIGARDPISWLFAHGVSASNMDIYGAMFSGAKLCAFEIKDNSFSALADWIDDQKLALLHTVPTAVRELCGAISPDRRFDSVRVVDLAGEMLFGSDVVRMRPHFRDDCLILNRLAATEASFIASLPVTTAHEKADGGLPVGTPPEGLEVAIVRPDGSQADVGETGAIAISSPHVATGYLNRPELDAAAFADVAERPGWRRYTSADLGFIDADGNLNFIGRSGSRIKLRGQAVDLAEVEAALHDCPAVTGAVVLPKIEAGEEAREILAFVTLAPGSAAEAGDIRKQLAEALPAYMLPSGYVILDKFPQTATSKVDRKALEAMDLGSARYRPGYSPPENETEDKVAAIFSEILGIQGVGRLDDFFLLGGDSLSLTNLQVLASQTFGRQFANLHENASVKGIAEWLDSGEAGSADDFPIMVPVQPKGSNPPLFVVHGRHGQAQVGPLFLKLLGDEQPFYALQARGLDGKQEPLETVQEMAAEYVAAIKTVQPRGPYFIGGFCAGGYIALEMLRLLQAGGDRAYPPLLIDPPVPPLKRAQQLSDRVLVRGIKQRAVTGEWKVDVGSSAVIDAALKVARAMEDALTRYEVRVPRIKAIVIATIERWREARFVKRYFGDQVHVFMVDGHHKEMLTPDNEQFAAAIRQTITHIARVASERRSKKRAATEAPAD